MQNMGMGRRMLTTNDLVLTLRPSNRWTKFRKNSINNFLGDLRHR